LRWKIGFAKKTTLNFGKWVVAAFLRVLGNRVKSLYWTADAGPAREDWDVAGRVAAEKSAKSGCILQISSVGGRLARLGSAGYHSAKWAVGGFTESLAQEVAPFGVKVCAVEPGGMRTNWGVRANKETPGLLPDYEPSVGAVIKALESYWGNEISDPAKVAQLILRLVVSDHLPAHLLVGSDAVEFAAQAEATREADAERWRAFSVSTDVNASGPLPAVRF